MSDGIERIAAERQRQIKAEGYTPEHDAEHNADSLIDAANAYIFSARFGVAGEAPGRFLWPWEPNGFKPSDPVRDLEKAGALIAAAIDRMNND